MSTIQNIGLTDITTVELGDSTIGEDINSRFDKIHNNFNVLSTTDYLKGDKGNSVKIIEFPIGLSITDQYPTVYEQNDLENRLTPEKLYNDLVLIITRESENENEDENEIENETQTLIPELNGLGGNGYNKIDLICEEVIENGIVKNIIKGSLPFLYLDPNFSNGQNLSTDKTNYSCLIVYGNNGMEKLNSIPKLYYDANIEDGENNKGSFCWEINGHQTGIIAQGPQGKNGRDGNCYIVKLGVKIEVDNKNFDENAGFYEIKQVFVSDENYIGWIDYEVFKENDNQLSIGSSCMCIFETYEYKLCFGVLAETSQDMESRIGVYTNLITNLVDFGSIKLLDALSNISSNSEAGIRGLFVPYTTKSGDGSTQRGHMIWANSMSDDPDTPSNEKDHSLHIGPVANVLDGSTNIESYPTYEKAHELNVHYENIKLHQLPIINPDYLNLEASSESEMIFANDIISEVILQLDEISIYQTQGSYYFDIAYYGIDQYTGKQNLIISREGASSSNDQAYYRGRKIYDGGLYDMWRWDTSDQHDQHDDDNVYVLTDTITMNGEINISSDNDIVLQSQSNLRLGSQGSSMTLDEKINISTDDDIIVNGSRGELKMIGYNATLQGDSNVSITDDHGDSIRLDSGINISSNDKIIIQSPYDVELETQSSSVTLDDEINISTESIKTFHEGILYNDKCDHYQYWPADWMFLKNSANLSLNSDKTQYYEVTAGKYLQIPYFHTIKLLNNLILEPNEVVKFVLYFNDQYIIPKSNESDDQNIIYTSSNFSQDGNSSHIDAQYVTVYGLSTQNQNNNYPYINLSNGLFVQLVDKNNQQSYDTNCELREHDYQEIVGHVHTSTTQDTEDYLGVNYTYLNTHKTNISMIDMTQYGRYGSYWNVSNMWTSYHPMVMVYQNTSNARMEFNAINVGVIMVIPSSCKFFGYVDIDNQSYSYVNQTLGDMWARVSPLIYSVNIKGLNIKYGICNPNQRSLTKISSNYEQIDISNNPYEMILSPNSIQYKKYGINVSNIVQDLKNLELEIKSLKRELNNLRNSD